MNTIPMEDINYLAQQSSERINMILAGMTALMNDTDKKVEALESQNWFQRMAKTITGKNKMTKNEIQQNHDKLNAYMSEAIAELYNRNCIDQAVMMSLGTQINELYADHVQLKQMLGAFVSKLNAKIDSVDNFHILNTEIEQGVYSEYAPIVAMCKIMAQFDNRVLDEERKIDILKRSMEAENIINDEEVPLANYLMTIADVPVDEIGAIYLELGTIRSNFLANIMLKTIEQYHFLPDMARKMKKKENIIANVIQSEELDDSVTLASSYIFEEFINSKIDAKNGFVTIELTSDQARETSSIIVEEAQNEQQQYTEQDTESDIDLKHDENFSSLVNLEDRKEHHIKQDTYELIKRRCSAYAWLFDEYNFASNINIERTLGMMGEETYLVHDASPFKDGLNGFAITKNGIYCKAFLDGRTQHVAFEELINTQTIYIQDDFIYADKKTLAYLPHVSRLALEHLKALFERIRMFVSTDLQL